jgi:hypothetical protein
VHCQRGPGVQGRDVVSPVLLLFLSRLVSVMRHLETLSKGGGASDQTTEHQPQSRARLHTFFHVPPFSLGPVSAQPHTLFPLGRATTTLAQEGKNTVKKTPMLMFVSRERPVCERGAAVAPGLRKAYR